MYMQWKCWRPLTSSVLDGPVAVNSKYQPLIPPCGSIWDWHWTRATNYHPVFLWHLQCVSQRHELPFSEYMALYFHFQPLIHYTFIPFGTVFDTYLISLIEAFHVSSTQPYFKIFVKVGYKMIELIMTIWHKMTWHTHDCRTHAGG